MYNPHLGRIVGKTQITPGKDRNVLHSGIFKPPGKLPGLKISAHVIDSRHRMEIQMYPPVGKLLIRHTLPLQ